MATTGEVIKVNPPQVHGIIKEDHSTNEYHFVMPNSAKPGYEGLKLSLGDRVTFEPDNNMAADIAIEGIPIITFKAEPTDVIVGSTSVLSYTSQEADSVTIEPDFGVVRLPSGSVNASPTVTTEYTFKATNGKGESIAKATVTVTDPH